MALAFIALGSNQGNRWKNIEDAIREMGEKCTVLKRSSMYETEPKYVENQPRFLNAVVQAETTLSPLQLLRFLQSIEKKLGRNRRKEIRFGPRTMDLDLLMYRNEMRNTERKTHDAKPRIQDTKLQTRNLALPHPRMHERAFVLVPLYEIEEKKWVKDALDDLPAREKHGVKKLINVRDAV